jgi:hypothetical protein
MWMTPLSHLPAPQLLDLSSVPAGALVIRYREALAPPGAAGEVVSRHGKYELVRVIQPPGAYWGERLLAARDRRAE